MMQDDRSKSTLPLTDRSIVVRPGVGAVGRVIQRAQLTVHRVAVDAATLILVLCGQKRIRWSSGDCVANAGDAIAVAAGQVVDITNTPGPGGAYGARWIAWTDESVSAVPGGASPVVSLSGAAVLQNVASGFKSAYQSAFESLLDVEGVPATIANHRSQEVLLWLRAHNVRFGTSRAETLVGRVRRTIAHEPARHWTVEEFARLEHSSPASFRRHLATHDQSFRGLLLDVRMSHALVLLQNTDAPVLSVATSVGYESPSRFAERFRERFGFLPSELRGHNRIVDRSRSEEVTLPATQ